MMKRILLGAVIGGVVMFVWGALAWMALPLHTATVKSIPNEDALRAVIRDNVKSPGFYALPGWTANREEQEQKYRQGPRGALVLWPGGGEPYMAKTFVTGFVLDVLAAFVAAWLLSKAVGGLASYGARVQFVAVTGLFAGIVTHLAYWNWMEFPPDYTVAYLADLVIGWTLVGLVLAAIVKPKAA